MNALIIAEEGVEDLEFYYPLFRLQEKEIPVDVAAIHVGTVTGKHGYEVSANLSLSSVKADKYDILILPGGKAPEKVRTHIGAVELVQDFFKEGKIVASICHGAQILVSAGVLEGRKATCFKGVKDDIVAAGANYFDQPVVVDGNLITSRMPEDLPYFSREIFKAVEAHAHV